jgi:hypothetical protein
MEDSSHLTGTNFLKTEVHTMTFREKSVALAWNQARPRKAGQWHRIPPRGKAQLLANLAKGMLIVLTSEGERIPELEKASI